MTKWAFITGTTSDLGVALAKALLKQGYHLLLTAPKQDKLEALPFAAKKMAADLTQRDQRKQVIAWIKPYAPQLMINNAGAGLYGPALSHPTEDQLGLLTLNAEATLELCLEGTRLMKKPGTILNISSAAAFFPYPYFSVYSASKRFLLDFSQGFDAEVKSKGIRVLCACPGQIDTSFRIKASKGRFHEKTAFTLSLATVIKNLLKQIEKQKPVQIIDWRYRILIAAQRWIGKSIRNRFLMKTMTRRIKKER